MPGSGRVQTSARTALPRLIDASRSTGRTTGSAKRCVIDAGGQPAGFQVPATSRRPPRRHRQASSRTSDRMTAKCISGEVDSSSTRHPVKNCQDLCRFMERLHSSRCTASFAHWPIGPAPQRPTGAAGRRSALRRSVPFFDRLREEGPLPFTGTGEPSDRRLRGGARVAALRVSGRLPWRKPARAAAVD